MSDKSSAETLSKFLLYIESSLKDLESKEVLISIRKTKDIEPIYTRTKDTIIRAKSMLNSIVDSQIYGKDN